MFQKVCLLLTCILLVAVLSVAPARGDVPRHEDLYVNDFAGLLSAQEAEDVRTLFRNLREEQDVEATLVTIGSIEDYGTGDDSIESFATRLFDDWGVGDAERNDGVLFLVAVEDRKVRIELGAGYGRRHDDAMEEMLDEAILPHLRNDDYGPGIVSGAVALTRHFGGPVHVEAPPGPEPKDDKKEIVLAVLAVLGALFGGVVWVIHRRSRTCPQCGRVAVTKESEILEKPTKKVKGKKKIRKECGACGWSGAEIVAITAASMGGSSGGGSFGGGVSGGGGATGGF